MKLSFLTSETFNAMVSSYLYAALWGSTCENPENPEEGIEMDSLYDLSDVSDSALLAAKGEVAVFYAQFCRALEDASEDTLCSLAHTLALSQIGHGVSFTDHREIPRDVLTKMADETRARRWPVDYDWYIGDDKKVYLSCAEREVPWIIDAAIASPAGIYIETEGITEMSVSRAAALYTHLVSMEMGSYSLVSFNLRDTWPRASVSCAQV